MTVDRQEIRKRYELVPATSCGYCGWTHVRPEHDENGTLWYRCERDKCGSLSAPRFRGDPSVIALIDSHDAADARIAALEAELVTEREGRREADAACAGMRAALERIVFVGSVHREYRLDDKTVRVRPVPELDYIKAEAALSPTAGRELLAELERLREVRRDLERHMELEERAHEGTIAGRDRAEEAADNLANAIARMYDDSKCPTEVIGEHSNVNCPWRQALELVDSVAAELTAYREWVPRAVEAMKGVQELAATAYQAWDSDQDHKVGKIIAAIAGKMKSYHPQATALSASIASAPKGANGG